MINITDGNQPDNILKNLETCSMQFNWFIVYRNNVCSNINFEFYSYMNFYYQQLYL